jgi:hypothetical protein
MLEVDWFDADIIYFSSVCYPDYLTNGVMDRCVNLKTGARMISLKPLPERSYIQMYAMMKVKMTWGLHQVTFYRKI